jgi:putative flippase GtrA
VKIHLFLQLGRFLSVGALNTIVGLLVIFAMKWFYSVSDVAANLLGYTVGLLLSFSLNSRWTFAYTGAKLPALAKFAAVTILAYCMNLVTVLAAIRYLDLNGYLAQVIGIVPYTVTSFLASKYIVFAPRFAHNE